MVVVLDSGTRRKVPPRRGDRIEVPDQTNPYTSVLTGVHVGRAMVIIPVLDEGLIEQSRAEMTTRKGNPASSAAELSATHTALGQCDALGLDDFVVYSDCASEVERVGDARVEWRPRTEMYLPNEFSTRFFTGPRTYAGRRRPFGIGRSCSPTSRSNTKCSTALTAGSS